MPSTELQNDRNLLACPRCKSTDLDFEALSNNMREDGTEPDTEVESGAYSWKCKSCKHEFVVTIQY